MNSVSVRFKVRYVSLMNVKIHWTKGLAPRKHAPITPKTVIIDLNEIKLMDSM